MITRVRSFLLLCVGVLLFACSGATAFAFSKEVNKETYLFAVKGSDTLRVDRYFCEGAETAWHSGDSLTKRPALLFAFGGGFVGGERDNARYVPFFEFLAKNGCQVFSTDYRTGLKGLTASNAGGAAGFATALVDAIYMAVEDYYDATNYIIQRSSEWGFDANALIACGSSAGAITVLQAEYEICSGGELTSHLPGGFNYAGVISFAGAVCTKGKPQWKNGSPCPIMLFHGDADSVVPFKKATVLGIGLYGSYTVASLLKELSTPYTFYISRGYGHEMAVLPLSENRYDILSFMESSVLRSYNKTYRIETDRAVPWMGKYKSNFTLKDYIRSNMGE